MSKLVIAAVALALTALPAAAQNNSSAPGSKQMNAPSAHNSGTGITGAPGNKNGPAPTKGTTGSGSANDHNGVVKQQDAAKIPGKPGGKSGPAMKKPSDSSQQ